MRLYTEETSFLDKSRLSKSKLNSVFKLSLDFINEELLRLFILFLF